MGEEKYFTVDNAMNVLNGANGCDDHKTPDTEFGEKDIAKVFYYWDNGADEFESETIFRLTDGRYVHAYEGSDYTGHG